MKLVTITLENFQEVAQKKRTREILVIATIQISKPDGTVCLSEVVPM
jgi:hypothetical protein